MKLVILFGTTEGHTRKVCGFAAARLSELGHTVDLVEAGRLPPSEVRLAGCDAVIVAASLHVGRYQPEVAALVRERLDEFDALPSAFLSVSLAAAGDEQDRSGLLQCVDAFLGETGWRPSRVLHVAGAFRFTEYDFFRKWAMKYIAWRKGVAVDTAADYELTDWDGLREELDALASEFEARRAAGQDGAS